MILLGVTIVTAASAKMPGHMGGGFAGPRTTIVVNSGFYSPFYSPFGYYGYSGYPYYQAPPSKLDLQIMNIKTDYRDKISSVRMDDSLNGKARREKIRELKSERDHTILDAKRNYYKS